MPLHPVIADVTDRIRRRSAGARAGYLDRMDRARDQVLPGRTCNAETGARLCGHGPRQRGAGPGAGGQYRHCHGLQRYAVGASAVRNLSRPDPRRGRAAGGTAQVAGGVPAMCDGVTQGQAGMELSLFSRDVIALAAGVALSHNTFDAALYLGVCDKIVRA